MELDDFVKFFDSEYTFKYLRRTLDEKLPPLDCDHYELEEIDYDVAALMGDDGLTHIPTLLLYGGYIYSALMFWVVHGKWGGDKDYFEYQTDPIVTGEYLTCDVHKILDKTPQEYIESLKKKTSRSIAEDRMVELWDCTPNQD